MLFSKRVSVIIILTSLLVPATVRVERDYFLPWIADRITFTDFSGQAPLYVDKPVRISGLTTGLRGLINRTIWNSVGPQLLLYGPGYRVSAEATVLLTHFPYMIFFDRLGELSFYLVRDNHTFARLRLQYGILSYQEIPLVFDQIPAEAPEVTDVVAYCRVLSTQGFNFYFLEFQSWQPP